MCKATAEGVYALKTDVDVYWSDEVNTAMPLFDPGRGKITIYFRGELSHVCDDGSGGTAIMHPCGTRLPALFTDAAHGIIQIVFPDTLWEKAGVPDYMTTGHTTGFTPGDTLVIDKTAGLLGISLMDINGTWPMYTDTPNIKCMAGMGDACFPDADGDGIPGITVNIQQTGMMPDPGYSTPGGWKFIPAPTSALDALNGVGATDVYIGLRTRLGGSGAIGADCKSGTGPGDVDDFESRVDNCKMKDGTMCSAMQASFVDQNTPTFHVLKAGAVPPDSWKFPGVRASELDPKLDRSMSKGPLSSVVRLGDLGQTFGCDMVRNAAYPAN